MHEPVITVVGNLGRDPRQRVLASGAVVADFRVASTPRTHDKASDSWVDGTTTWFSVTCWRTLAENAAQSLHKGDRVIVTGRLTTKTWLTPEGEERSTLEIDASSVGFDLSRGPVIQQRVRRSDPAEGQVEPGGQQEAVEPQAA